MIHTVAIVTPLYKRYPSAVEISSLMHGFEVLREHQRFIVAPDNLDLSEYRSLTNNSEIIRFNAKYFKSIRAYNQLLLSKFFFQHFIAFDFLLIFQSDAFVFCDSLDYWCKFDYDYVGAPWPNGLKIRPITFRGAGKIARVISWLNKPVVKFVGNGGLSLRKVSSALEILSRHWLIAKTWSGNEDEFWSLYSPKVPTISIASMFSLEQAPSSYYHANNNQLPFGCHAWEKFEPDFWRIHLNSAINR